MDISKIIEEVNKDKESESYKKYGEALFSFYDSKKPQNEEVKEKMAILQEFFSKHVEERSSEVVNLASKELPISDFISKFW